MSTLPNAAVIQKLLTNPALPNVQIHTFEQLESTSAWLHAQTTELIGPGTPVSDVHLCIADWQSAGVGRRSRVWLTQAGNVTFSLLSQTSRPVNELMGLSLVTGIAVVQALQKHLGLQAQLKWPNDVLLNDAKLGGLLTEITKTTPTSPNDRVSLLYTGIGINLRHDETVLDLGIGATSLEAHGVATQRSSRDELIAAIVSHVLLEHQRFLNEGWQAFADRWKALDWLLDREILIHREGSTEQAVARGVNEQGALLVECGGETLPLFSGNVSVRPVR